ncbi:carbohydrate esterase family 5 protein [Colletotrichum tofieldiae]|uniref:Cutinase n=1 Tax=Colletotrichum tofieldiae TaxID=708197 RepID=A0A161YHV0_9PEZI|nr:carbohydrate esterase family 5 protein [Colletotrichum tofieldiae]GKT56441.1 carbohydrate esterase family 5 protein [Colletotrichum tofieldiae]GKT76589.1 carbohydrate esterase family 5 protein [Colletotrichum tofieldiae]GKT87641.1 carbohydrate esterase family 5 protein [Colletotrichum tofieldiae]
MHRSTAAFLLALLGTALASPVEIQPRQADFSGNQQDGLNGDCKSMIVIFARGTTEGGNVGTIAGPPFFQALSTQVGGNLAVQGVEYPADIPGFLAGGDANGSQMMATLTEKAITSCPNSAVIMSGYSQGGQLVHNGAAMMSAATVAKVAGVVIFGDPLNGQPVQGVDASRTKIICHNGDNICEGGNQIRRAHLTYGNDAPEAAQFAASMMPAAAAPAAA